ncbi:TetR/AcrR family transcriptional regulator [Vandammella animalimorsus]|uniref:TetR family transcriptional regulator n=1 Tax=Vandammella animalimorsus TaxID=2029117 RepID=A0A2A2AYG8_9BURK|nr:TetR/AcrR family transcriptional regulator [Vandammella animalimorsus]PAT43620.1 TetR family transcriptional regulator [Vandammella animalimorsus]
MTSVRPRSASAAISHKGQQTRQTILDAALRLVAQVGLEGLSIGALAELAGMSKSGVFAHFGSREELQIAVIEQYHQGFAQAVFQPALEQSHGLPRLRRMVQLWMQHTVSGVDSGVFISGAVDFDDRPGPVCQALQHSVRRWMDALQRAVAQSQAAGHLSPDAPPAQLVFEIHALVLALHYEVRFLRNPTALDYAQHGFERLIAAYAPALHQPP